MKTHFCSGIFITVFAVSFLLVSFLFQPVKQTAAAQEAEFGLNLQLGLPQGPFQDQLDEIGFGIHGMAGYLIPNTPVMLGLDAGFLTFGTDRRDEPLSSNIPDVRVRVENSYNMANFNFLVRLTGRDAHFRPYADFLVGFNYLFTDSVVRSRGGSQEEVFRDTNFDDFTLSYGVGAGMRFMVWDVSGTGQGQGRLYINTGARYMAGGKAEYIQPGSITTEGGELDFDVSRSRTDLLSFHLGVTFVLN